MRIRASSIAVQTAEWRTAAQKLDTHKVRKITVPLPKPSELPSINAQLRRQLSTLRMQELANAPVNLHIHFEPNNETQVAFNTLLGGASLEMFKPTSTRTPAAPQARPPVLTVGQGVAGGAVIGAVGGAGVSLLLQGLKSTADASGNPILSALGAVLLGISAGAIGGTIIATGYTVEATKDGIKLGPGSPAPAG